MPRPPNFQKIFVFCRWTNDITIIFSSIKNESFLKIWRVWHILKVCHALWYLKIEMGIAGSIFELHPPNFQKMCIFWRFTNDISTIFCYLLWFQFWKKCQSLPVHPKVVPVWSQSTPILLHKMTFLHFLGTEAMLGASNSLILQDYEERGRH